MIFPLLVSLIYHYVGKLKDIRDAACGGISYYQSLLKSKAAVSVSESDKHCIVMLSYCNLVWYGVVYFSGFKRKHTPTVYYILYS